MVSGSDAASKEEFGGSEGAGGDYHSACNWGEFDLAYVATVVGGFDYETCCVSGCSIDPFDRSVEPKLEVGACFGCHEVGGLRTSSFSIGEHIRCVAECSVLFGRDIVCSNTLPSSC